MPRRIDQTILASDPARKGNCVSACVATILDIPLERVPHFVEYGLELGDEPEGKVSNGNAWWAMMLGFFYAWEYTLVELDSVETSEDPWEYLLVAGQTSRGVLHQVVYRAGALWHDPHPSREGLTSIVEVLAVRPLSPFNHHPTEES